MGQMRWFTGCMGWMKISRGLRFGANSNFLAEMLAGGI